MKIFTREQNLKTLVARWGEKRGEDSDVYKKLVAAGDSLTIEEAKRIIVENGSTDADWWLEPECDNCKRMVDKVIQMGDQVDWCDWVDHCERTACICLDCLRAATRELGEIKGGGRDRFLSLLYVFQDASVMVTRATDAEWRRESLDSRNKIKDVLLQAFETGNIPDSVWESEGGNSETGGS